MISKSIHQKRKPRASKSSIHTSLILAGNALGLGLISVFLLGMGMERFHYQRFIDFSLPPLEANVDDSSYLLWVPDYGQVAVIIDEEGKYFLHFREHLHFSHYRYLSERTQIDTGLNGDCLHLFREEDFEGLLHYLALTEADYVLTYSCLPQTKFGDLIRFLDKLWDCEVRKHSIVPLTKEEEEALTRWKKDHFASKGL